MRSPWQILKVNLFVSGKVSLGKRFHIGLFSYVSSAGGLAIGDDVYVGKYCSVQCSGRIGDGVLIANNVGIIGARDHDMRAIGTSIRHSPWIGSSPQLADDPKNSIDIGSDVWIGFGAVLLSGIRVGRGAIVAAGTVVTTDVAPYDIVAGNPAAPIGRRFSDAQIGEHEALLWGAAS